MCAVTARNQNQMWGNVEKFCIGINGACINQSIDCTYCIILPLWFYR